MFTNNCKLIVTSSEAEVPKKMVESATLAESVNQKKEDE